MDEYIAAQMAVEEAVKHRENIIDKLLGTDVITKVYKPTEHDVMVIQYLRPDGRPRIMYAPLGKEYVEKSKDMVCSAEELRTGQIVIYVRWKDQPPEKELIEFAENGPGENSPNNVLSGMIDRLWENK